MSLKNFHLLFISCAVLLALFVAVWAFGERVDRGNVMVVPAAAALAAGVGLVLYELSFLRRWRQAGLR